MTLKPSYVLAPKITQEVANELREYSPLQQQLLFARNIVSKSDADQFFYPSYTDALHDPFLFRDMEKAVKRILTALKNDEHIAVYSDYDCDGIPGGVLLHDFFTAINYPNFENYIPHRHDEGYGFNKEAVDTLEKSGTKLVITVDCGIVDTEAVAEANRVGIDVIVTDHHEPNGTLPDAHAIINPKYDEQYPFSGLCGTGVAFKLVLALIEKGKEEGMITLKEGWEKWWLDVVGIATIADMVPLIDENRVLASYGLAVLRKSKRPGLQHLLRRARMSQRHLTEDDIGFTIGPRINAASRMDTPEDAFRMLATRDEGEAGARVEHLEKLNNERRGMVAAMTKELKKRMQKIIDVPNVIVLGDPQWRPALVGLAANSLVDEYRRPVFLWGRDGKNVIKGSCRSDGIVSVVHLMEHAKETLKEFGGHHASGGFSIDNTHIHNLSGALNKAYKEIVNEETPEFLHHTVDLDITLDDITKEFVREIRQLAPFGVGNPKPLFRFLNIVPDRIEQFGKTKDHLKVVFKTKWGTIEAVDFYFHKKPYQSNLSEGKLITLIGHVEETFFMNRMQTRIRIVDIV